MTTVIQVDQLRKQYGAKVALDGISLEIHKGEIFGIVGPNGAGKTTLIEIIEGLRLADSGTALVLGMDIRKQAEAIKQRIGVLLQSTSIPGKAKVKEVLSLFASFYERTADVSEISRIFGLADKQNAYFKSLSGGWKQRVSLALSLINDPDIVFLDEPSMGLDPNARSEMWDTIKRLRDEGRTIVVTTHYMEEAEVLCDRVAIIDSGRLIALDAPKQLISMLGGVKRISFSRSDAIRKESLSALTNVVSIEWEPTVVRLHSTDLDQTLKELFQLAEGEDWMVRGLKLEEASMNDVFNQLTLQQEVGIG
ncbi:ABC transporter ATP-binding protein [Paenibacillus spongiae]|uniref:ABC transporter ATP-binding protein n=1 Tax=Paenibacillus spongiae TaxID=2909671 RepID=A0ABY5SDH5_9BACL|nr:ABC transporter ATP-binding protein [Paenibacillus spongiae]UVI30775.1 ABC transporter ATP-binding protein [Paenibacillus spongiae]